MQAQLYLIDEILLEMKFLISSLVFKSRLSIVSITRTLIVAGSVAFSGAVLANKPADSKLPLSELGAFTEAYYQIKSSYVEDVDDITLIRAAIKGMVDSLDNHSRFLPPEEFEQFNNDNIGEYAGIGLSFNEHKFGIEVAQVIKNSPAARAGIREGMIVTHIDTQPINFLSAQDAITRLKGEVGSSIELVVAASDFPQPKTIQLQREIVLLESVSSAQLPNNVGYVAISQFTLNSVDEFKQAVGAMSVDGPLNQLIIDLRNNPGGVMEIAVELADLFITEGKLLISNGRSADSNEVFYASQVAPYADLDVVLMINQGSASASEILAAALKDHHKATLVGETSYGKGSIQTVIPLNKDSGMKLTTAEYFSPLGTRIQDIGIDPDVKFSKSELENTYNVSLLDDPELLQAYNLLSSK